MQINRFWWCGLAKLWSKRDKVFKFFPGRN